MGQRVCHIQAHTKRRDAFICAYWDAVGQGNVTDDQIRYAVKFAAGKLQYPQRGMDLGRMDTHLLRSGGVCALKLAGYDEVEIRKMGRWAPKSNAFLEYIQSQLSTSLIGMVTTMRNIQRFSNMEGAATNEDLRPLTIA